MTTSPTTFYRILLIFVVAALLILVAFTVADTETEQVETVTSSRVPEVTLIDPMRDGLAEGLIRTTGLIESASQVDVRAQAQAIVLSAPVVLGQYVQAGQVLVELDAADVSASVEQARAGLEAERIRLTELERGVRTEERALLLARRDQALRSVSTSEVALTNAVRDGMTRADDAIRTTVDPMFIDARTAFPRLSFNPFDYQIKVDVERDRPRAGDILTFWTDILLTDSRTDMSPELTDQALQDLTFLKRFVDRLSMAVNYLEPTNELPASTINVWQSGISATRAGIDAALSALSASAQSLEQARSAVVIVDREIALSDAGASDEQIEAQRARVRSAEAQYDALLAQLDKLSIRAPISGQVAELYLDTGALLSPGQHIMTIINTRGLIATAFLDTSDVRRLSVGDAVKIGDVGTGIVRHISPALNRETRKVEVVTDITGGHSELFAGAYEAISFNVSALGDTVPLTAIRTRTGESVVLTVDENSRTTAVPVSVESITGDTAILARPGVPSGTLIIADARGIEVGQQVRVRVSEASQ